MRRILALGGMIGVVAVAGAALAQNLPSPPVASAPPPQAPQTNTQQVAPPGVAGESKRTVMTVKVAKVEVRSGPSEQFPPTSELSYGQQVAFLRESEKNKGWYEIEPPHGSFSWINDRFISISKTNERIGTVYADENSPPPVLAGSSLIAQEPNVEVAKAKRGSIVAILGPARNSQQQPNTMLLPIQPLQDEVRYVPASALEPANGVQVAAAQVGSSGGFQGTAVYQGTGQTAKIQADQHLEQARRLYEQAVHDPSLDPSQRQQALSRLQALGGGTGQLPGQPNPTQGQLVSGPTRPQPAAGGQQTFYNNPPPSGPQWSSWGVLRRSGYQRDGQPTYVLTDRNVPILYAVAEPGKTLDPYLGKMMTLYGTVSYRSDELIRSNVMTVQTVHLAQGQ